MENPIIVTLDENGTTRSLVSETGAAFLTSDSIVKRASHVEPVNPALRAAFHSLRWVFGENGMVGNFTRQWVCLWRINLAPVSGPVLPYELYDRDEAIALEVEWLHNNFLITEDSHNVE